MSLKTLYFSNRENYKDRTKPNQIEKYQYQTNDIFLFGLVLDIEKPTKLI